MRPSFPSPRKIVWPNAMILALSVALMLAAVALDFRDESLLGFLFAASAIGCLSSLYRYDMVMLASSAVMTVTAVSATGTGHWWIPTVALLVGIIRFFSQTPDEKVVEESREVSPELDDLLMAKEQIFMVTGFDGYSVEAVAFDADGNKETRKFEEGANLIWVGPARGSNRERLIRRLAVGFLRVSGAASFFASAMALGLIPVASLTGIAFLVGAGTAGLILVAAITSALIYIPVFLVVARAYAKTKETFSQMVPEAGS